MIDVLIPFLFGLMVGAGGGVMIAALLVASRDTPPQPHEIDLIRRQALLDEISKRIQQLQDTIDQYSAFMVLVRNEPAVMLTAPEKNEEPSDGDY